MRENMLDSDVNTQQQQKKKQKQQEEPTFQA